MKTTIATSALATVCLTSSVAALISMQVRYTDNLINVGNLDAFTATWETLYAAAGNLQGVVSDKTYGTDENACQTDDKEDLTVEVKMDGAWGIVGNATSANMRDAIIVTMWNSLDALWNQSQYIIYEGCTGTTWQDTPLYSSTAACGPRSAASCAEACSDVGTPDLVQCTSSSYGSLLPSEIKVTTYEDGTLLADELTVTFAATANDISDGGCGLVGTLTEKFASFIPYVGGLFAAGITYECGTD